MFTPAELAEKLVRARVELSPLSAGDPEWDGLSIGDAQLAGDLVCREWGATDSPYWKLGAIDAPTQNRLGVTGPISAPLAPDSVRFDVQRIELSMQSFIQAKFEPEIGVRVVAGQDPQVMPCVEVADSRFRDWVLPPNGIFADAALQAMMLFGPIGTATESMSVAVYLDGKLLGSGQQDWQESTARLSVLPTGAKASHVATGALTKLFEVTPGEWLFDFGSLGQISILVL